MYYWNPQKEDRARRVCEDPEQWLESNRSTQRAAEYKLYKQGVEQELEGEELVKYVYEGLGGKVLSDEEAGELADKMNESERIQPDPSKPNRDESCPGCGETYKNLKLHAHACEELSDAQRKRILDK